jgi:hypothetical protein
MFTRGEIITDLEALRMYDEQVLAEHDDLVRFVNDATEVVEVTILDNLDDIVADLCLITALRKKYNYTPGNPLREYKSEAAFKKSLESLANALTGYIHS